MTPAVTITKFTPAPALDADNGRLGRVDLVINGLAVRGVGVCRSREGREHLRYPEQQDHHGRRWHSVRPADDAMRAEVEAIVFAELRRSGRLAA
jgi:hypothetical protein